ncbi:MAG TPA: PrsW family glutamic-type intramembrane protease [Chloroflexota bacterium]|nr:PrsW family glutamic-type intramembrane protease [Chloroflexota bacterium]
MFHLSAVSTLFPHLPHRRSAPFRLALLVAGGLLVVLGIARLTGPAIALAAIAVPVLYVLYLWEVEVYEDEPVTVTALTFVLGILLGIPWAWFTGPIVTATLLGTVIAGPQPGKVLLAGVVFPLAAQVLMLLGPLFLFFYRRRYDEALDGFTFGAASALGFTLATTFVNLWPELRLGLVTNADPATHTLTVLERGLLNPFLAASTTGLIAGALWLRRGKVRSLAAHGWTTTLWTSILVAAVVWVVLGLVNVSVLSTGVAVGAYLLLTMAMLLWVRVALHHMLLAEAVEVQVGPMEPCFHCHRIEPRMAFCPHCGIATRATPKTGTGRLRRAFR